MKRSLYLNVSLYYCNRALSCLHESDEKYESWHLHIFWMNFVTMHNFMQSYKIMTKMTENCDSKFSKMWEYAKKVE